jgi:hypothetical protein
MAPANPRAARAKASFWSWADFVPERIEEMASQATVTRMAKGTANAASILDLIWRNTVAFLVARLLLLVASRGFRDGASQTLASLVAFLHHSPAG